MEQKFKILIEDKVEIPSCFLKMIEDGHLEVSKFNFEKININETFNSENPQMILLGSDGKNCEDVLGSFKQLFEADIPLIYLNDEGKKAECSFGLLIKPFSEADLCYAMGVASGGKLEEHGYRFPVSNCSLKDRYNEVIKDEFLFKPIYSMRMASKLTDVEPNLIRIYEKQGMVKPYRDPGNNYRYFTLDEINWINRIKYLIHKKGLTIESIKWMLTLVPCWVMNQCGQPDKEKCISYSDTNIPCWLDEKKDKKCGSKHCYNCVTYVMAKRHPKFNF
ncbi:MAG: MerR family transcriptional regulator [Vulcanimicrobiota bacterium]